MPCGFMFSTAAAENVEAGRIDANTAGRVAARRAVRANIVQVDGWVKEDGGSSQIDKVQRAGHVIGQTLNLGGVYACKQCVSAHRTTPRLHTPTDNNDAGRHAWTNREQYSASQAHDLHQNPPEQLTCHRSSRRRRRFLPTTRCLHRICRLPEIDRGASQGVHCSSESAGVMLLRASQQQEAADRRV